MSDLLNATLEAVGAAGDAFDKVTGGRALRGALAGKTRELASIIPFSDSMGLTDEHDKTSGRDLTDAYGITGKGDTSFGSSAAGFLADNVLSPGNLIGGVSAFKAAPTIAKGVKAATAALTGFDALGSMGRGVNRIAGKFGKLPLPGVPQYGVADDMVKAYDNVSSGFPKEIPLGTYHTPDSVRAAHTGAMPDAADMKFERRNNARIEQYTGSDRRIAPQPLQHGDAQSGWGVEPPHAPANLTVRRFSNPHQGPHIPVPNQGGLPQTREALEAMLASMGFN